MEEGTPVHAARSGVIARTEASNSVGCWRDECAGRANFIVVLHDDETTGEYYHLQKDGVLVTVGERIRAGQKIGLSGNTGHSALPHLHFGIYRAIDDGKEQSIPFRFLSADGIIDRPRRGGMYVATDPRTALVRDGDQQTGAETQLKSNY
jgi:murein DD-endopeptidase MepM/ murein hydrolase activator NlpD